MSNSTPKRALSSLMSKFRRSGSDESSSYSSAEEEAVEDSTDLSADEGDISFLDAEEEIQIAPLVMAPEGKPESWLGQFLLELDLAGVSRRGTIAGARLDTNLLARLNEVRASSKQGSPLDLLDAERAARLREEDWAAWWRAQEMLSKYAYATLALSLLGDLAYVAELQVMYRQETNSRIRKDAHYVLCYLLGKEWPGYEVTEGDFERLMANAL